MLDGSDFPKQGRKSAGVTRQYCGRLGKVANCQAGMFLAYVSPLGRALVDKRLYLPESWTSDEDRCAAAGVPEERRGYRSTQLALEILEETLARGHLEAGWVAGDTPSGCRRPSVRDWRPWGCATCWTFPAAPGLAAGASLDRVRSIRGSGVPASPSSWPDSADHGGAQPMNCRRRLGGR